MLYVIVCIIFIYSILQLGVFSKKFTFPVIFIFLILLLVIYFGLQGRNKKSVLITRVSALALTMVLILVSTISLRGSFFISNAFNSNYEEYVISFVVLKESPEETFEDIVDSPFLANINGDSNSISKLSELVIKKFDTNLKVTYFEGYSEVLDHFYTNENSVFVLVEAQRVIIEELYPNFTTDTKIIDQVSYRSSTDVLNNDRELSDGVFTMFVTGIDTFGPVSTVSRSDVNMLVTVNPQTNQILLTNLPRDTQVELASFGKLDKLTHAGIYGVNESIKTLENFLDISIDYYLKVNFNSLKDIVDAMGGVDIDSQFEFDNNGFVVRKGLNHLDGEQALTFARARYSLPDMDNDRILNHQALMIGLIDKLTSTTFLTRYSDILSSINGSFELSMPDSLFRKLLKTQIDSNPKWKIVTNTVMGEEIWSETTYSMPGYNLYLVNTYPEELLKSKSYFLQIYSNNLITD